METDAVPLGVLEVRVAAHVAADGGARHQDLAAGRRDAPEPLVDMGRRCEMLAR